MKLRKHQRIASKSACDRLKRFDRTTVVIPPGGGKTYVAYDVYKKQHNDVTFVFCPNVTLVYQAMCEFAKYGVQAELIAFTAGRMSKDQSDYLDSLGYSQPIITTNAVELKKYLNQSPNKTVIFSTYQAATNLISAKVRCDFAIFDEAHHIAGRKGKAWARLLENKYFFAEKRLFITATPRRLSKANRLIADMSDTKMFGEICYSMSLNEATKQRILVPIEIILATYTGTQKGKLNHKKLGAIHKAIRSVKGRRGLSFHHKVIEAQDFATRANRYRRTMNVHALSASNTADERQAAINSIEKKGGMISNVRLFGEGFDYSALDHVVLHEAKYSWIEIYQIIGRVLRKHKRKSVGRIIIPLDATDVDDDAKFSKTLQIIWQILASDDGFCTTILNENRQQAFDVFRNRVKVMGGVRLHKKIVDKMKKFVEVRKYDQLSWADRMTMLEDFVNKEKRVPSRSKAEEHFHYWTYRRTVCADGNPLPKNIMKRGAAISERIASGEIKYGAQRICVFDGKVFPSISAASKYFDVPGHKLRKMQDRGDTRNPNKVPDDKRQFMWDDKAYPNKMAAARAIGVDGDTLRKYIRWGYNRTPTKAEIAKETKKRERHTHPRKTKKENK